MATVRALLDDLAAGRLSAAQVAADFRARTWPPRRESTEAQMWGVEDYDPPAEDSWELVEAYPGLSASQRAVLRRAHLDAFHSHH